MNLFWVPHPDGDSWSKAVVRFRRLNVLRRLPGSTNRSADGIALYPDERTLYVPNTDFADPYIYADDSAGDGTVGEQCSEQRIFFDSRPLARSGRRGGTDGMVVDDDGNLWATRPGGVLILDPTGRHLGTILTGQATANCTLDRDGSTLYITADGYLLRVRLG